MCKSISTKFFCVPASARATRNKAAKVEYSADYGLSNNVSWAAQWANAHGVTNFKNFAVSGSEPSDWFGKGQFAATSKERTTLFPDTPTIMEAGVRDYAVGTWWGIVGPPRLSEPVIATLNQAVNDAAASETMRKRFANEGAEPFRGSPGDFAALLQEELKNWRKVVDEGGLKFD